MSAWSWINVLSLDAMAVAVAWQALFARAYCHRWPRWHEAAALALAVWLIYVGDRLLDARRLDLSRPHLLRHRMHADHAGRFAAAWCVGCVAAAWLVWRWLEVGLVRLGLVVAGLVLVYLAGVHGRTRPLRRGTKELRVGLLFAGGVSVVCWNEAAGASLLAATFLAGLLFAANCMIVAWREVDGQPAGPGRRGALDAPGGGGGAVRLLLGVVALGAVLGAATGGLPAALAAGVFAGAVALLGVGWGLRSSPPPLRVVRRDAPTLTDPGGVLVDAALLVPPVLAAVAVAWLLAGTAAV